MDSTNQISGWDSLYASAQQCFGLNNETHYRRELSRFGLNRLGPGCYVLDMGCGVGGAMKALRETSVGHIFGVDISLDLLRKAVPFGPVLVTSCVSTGLASGVFDVVLIIGLLHHLEDYEDVESTLSEVYRLLKPGGRLVLNEPAPTYFRRLVTPLLLSPLANLTSYSRTMRTLVKYEMPVLERWLSNFGRLVPSVELGGLRLDWVKLGLLRVSLLASKEPMPAR